MIIDNQISKNDLRKLLKEESARFRRNLVGEDGIAVLASQILASLENLPTFRKASTILLYASIEGEVPTLDFIWKWSSAKTIILPCVVSDTDMELRKFVPDNFRRGAFGILEPDESCEIVDALDVDLVVVPGLAFAPIDSSPDGGKYARLGRGKGYYDRLLPRLSCPKIGLCFPYQFVDFIPQDEWDIPVDIVIYN